MSDDFSLEISRVLKAPRARLWEAWSNPQHLAQWWCPKPWTTEVLALELFPGGAFETIMRAPAGEDGESSALGCVLEVVPQEKLIFTTTLRKGYRPADKPWLAMTAMFTMADEAGGTRYIARALHATPAEARRHEEMGFHDGWGAVAAQLEAYARTLAS